MAVRGLAGDQTGAGLVFALAVLLLVAMASQAALAVVAYELKATAQFRDASRAFQVAEAGAERAVFELGRDPDWTDRAGATALVGQAENGWAPLCLDPGSEGHCSSPSASVPFPTAEPLGNFTVLVKRGLGPQCGPEGCLCVRSTGSAGAAVRRVEVGLTREQPDKPVKVVSWREVLGEYGAGPCQDT